MATSHSISIDDLWAMQAMGKITLSPDGRQVAFVISSTDKAKNETSSAIFLLQLDEHGAAVGKPCQLTSGTKSDTNPVWAPDSKRLLFLSNREERNQLWLINTDGGEARKLTNMWRGVSDAAWSPDGQWIAFTAPVGATDDEDLLTGRKVLDEVSKKGPQEQERLQVRSVTDIWYRLDGRGLRENFMQLFVMPAPTVADPTCDPATIRRLTSGRYDHLQPQWTPDSSEIGVLCNRNTSGWPLINDLWLINHETTQARLLTEGDLEIYNYAWSPDGQAAVLVATKDPTSDGFGIGHLYLVTRRGNVGDHPLCINPDFERDATAICFGSFGLPRPNYPQWSQDGQQIYFLASDEGCVHIYRLEVVWRTIARITHNTALTSYFALLPGDQSLLLAQEDADHPWELYRLALTNNNTQEPERLTLTHIYDQWLAERQWGKIERIRYKGALDDEIDGWLIYPISAREGVRYPLLVRIHGGPNSSYSVGSALDPLNHYFAAQGYAIFYCNPHGSTTYGEAFMRQNVGDWGGADYLDIMLGVDVCIERGVADPERLLVTGASYGGYMTMFIIGHTERFKAAVPIASLSDLASFVGTSDLGFWLVLQAQGHPWDAERVSYYHERSPITSVQHIVTPTLIVHPENDLRCPIGQSEQLYIAMNMLGKAPVEFVRIPAAWHTGAEKPSQSLAIWEKIADWLHTYIEIRPEEYT